MEPLSQISILKEQKQSHNSFSFFINKNKEEDTFIHDFLCQPRIPLIGKYQHSDYSFGSILSLITLTTPLTQSETNKKKEINIPLEIIDYLNVNEVLTINNNTKTKNANFFHPKIFIKFYFAISCSPTGSQSESDQFNLVPHVFLNKTIDFSKQKRVVYNTPMTLFLPKDISQSSGVIFKNAGNSDIDINNLRLEYSSIHLKGQSLALSPNNLKFSLNTKMDINHFYVLITQEESDYHHLFYYILVNNKELKSKIELIVKNAQTLEYMISQLELIMQKENSEILVHLKTLFN